MSGHDEKHHDPTLAHHFDTKEQQREAGKLGMWLFLATEILIFGGLFCAYSVYRSNHPEIFVYAHQYLDKFWGGVNTLILICSSFTMAWAVRAAQLGQKKLLVRLLLATVIFACGFLCVKYVEYKAKWEHGLLPGRHYAPHHEADPHGDAAAAEDHGESATVGEGGGEGHGGGHGEMEEPENVRIFFSIYFMMTGLHGIHVLIGIIAILWITLRATRDEFGPHYFMPVDLVGLYWHLVDLIWIYLFPLLYLIH